MTQPFLVQRELHGEQGRPGLDSTVPRPRGAQGPKGDPGSDAGLGDDVHIKGRLAVGTPISDLVVLMEI